MVKQVINLTGAYFLHRVNLITITEKCFLCWLHLRWLCKPTYEFISLRKLGVGIVVNFSKLDILNTTVKTCLLYRVLIMLRTIDWPNRIPGFPLRIRSKYDSPIFFYIERYDREGLT